VRHPNTLFVIGAGASAQAGMPTGKQLIDTIADRLGYRIEHGSLRDGSGDRDILAIFQHVASFFCGAHLIRSRIGAAASDHIWSYNYGESLWDFCIIDVPI
jgi:hypothetical protein